MNYSRNQSPSPRVMDQLEEEYNNEAKHNWQDHKKKQNLYYKIVQMEQASMNDRRSMQKQLKHKEDEKVKAFWRASQAEEDKFREMQRRRKEEIDNVRKANQNMSLEAIQQAKQRDSFEPYNDYNEFYVQQIKKQKREKQQFMRNAEEYEAIRKQKQKTLSRIDLEISQMKFQESDEIQRKRLADLKRIRDKHQQNYAAYYQLDDTLKQKQMQQHMLESYIVNKGANDQQARLLEHRAQFEKKEKQRKQSYIKGLKNQLEDQTYRHIADRKNQINIERQQFQQRNRYFSELEEYNKMKKSQSDKKMLEVLKSQVKPRRLLPEPDTIEKVGLGSPINIGKVVGDDRKRQLEWIQKSLLREIHY